MPIKPGKYIHFKGNEYEVTGTATHSETLEEMVVYRALYGEGGLWVRPAAMWEEIVEHNGRRVKRFTHKDELVATPVSGVNNYSPPAEKIELFLSLFAGREDVVAKRWENAGKGRSGYVPACISEWSPACPKTGGGRMKCGDCPDQNFIRLSTDVMEKHLKGQLTIGVYPMFPDETCRFLAFDFDGKDYRPEELRRDVSAIREICAEKQIGMAVERSRSGKGIHFWVFFSENIPAVTARKFGSSLITYAMDKHHELKFETYDRLIPNQDTMPKGGFGSLIALPLQKSPREKDNSVFIDEHFNAYADQWNYLYNIRKYSHDEIESFIHELSPSGELGALRKTEENEEDEKPWEGRKSAPAITRFDFPEMVNIVCSNMLYIRKDGISNPALNTLKRLAAFRNPEFYKAQALRLSTHKKRRIISCSDETEQYLCLPRGLDEEIGRVLKDSHVKINWADETNTGRGIDVSRRARINNWRLTRF